MDRNQQIDIVNSWMQDLSQVFDTKLELDKDGICTLQVGSDSLAIEVGDHYPTVGIYGSLMPLPVEDKELSFSLLTRSLELNAFQIATRGGAIAVAPGGGLLIYCYSTPIEGLDSEKFSEIFGGFFETLTELKKILLSPNSNVFKNETGPTHSFLKG